MVKKDSIAHLHHSSGTLSAKGTFLFTLKLENDTVVKPLGLLTKHEYSAPRTEASAHQIKCNLKKSWSFLSHLHLFPPDFPSQLWRMSRNLYPISMNFTYLSEEANGWLQWGSRVRSLGWSRETAMKQSNSITWDKLSLTRFTVQFMCCKSKYGLGVLN